MTKHFMLLAFLLNLFAPTLSRAADIDGQKMLTPNQQRKIVQVNRDLPKDVLDQPGDSLRVAELRGHLRENLSAYRVAVKQFGTGTKEAHLAAQPVVEAQAALHKQFVKEEAIPAVAVASR